MKTKMATYNLENFNIKTDKIQYIFNFIIWRCVACLFVLSLNITFIEYLKKKIQKKYSKPSCAH